MTKILFVCLGNIIRSPAGEEILRQKAKSRQNDAITVASCGVGDWHVGQLPHETMRRKAKERGYDLQSRAQTFHPLFFSEYDYILAADRTILEELLSQAPDEESKKKIFLITAFSKKFRDRDVPDPYFGDEQLFHHALDILEDSCDGLLEAMQEKE